MSDAADKSSRPSSGFRRRSGGRGGRGGRRSTRPRDDENAAPRTEEESGEVRERPERPPNVPVPEEYIGTARTGTVVDTIRNRRFNFGFIALGFGEEAYDRSLPRVYYNPSYIAEEGLNIYRGYEVEFTIDKDEEGRAIAKDIKLTENGLKIKEEREISIAERRVEKRAEREAERAANPDAAAAPADGDRPSRRPRNPRREGGRGAGGAAAGGRGNGPRAAGDRPPRRPRNTEDGGAPVEDGDRPPRVRRERRERREPREPSRTAEFTVTVEGSDATGTITFPIASSLGRLKSMACKEVDASLDFSVYLITEANPRGVFVTRAVLNEVQETGTLLLIPKREEDNIDREAVAEN